MTDSLSKAGAEKSRHIHFSNPYAIKVFSFYEHIWGLKSEGYCVLPTV